MTEPSAARRMWALFEPLHAVVYFAPLSAEAFTQAGLTGFWRRYFAGRAAALGAVGAGPVVAAFFGFAPAMVSRALPDVWSRISPAAALEARRVGATAALTGLFDGLEVGRAAELLAEAARAADFSGRVLAAAHADLPWPDDPVGKLWHAATILREHRGDGHVAALLTAGVDGCESLAWRAALDGGRLREVTQPARGWTDDEWQAATGRLRERGWVDADGTATGAGRDAYAKVEQLTDELAADPWRGLDTTAVELLAPLTERAWAIVPADNPIPLRRTDV
ncbi:hypothetical protein JIG36_09315 [Actinoplanes sp. LDG1-06]|uniref:SalK n=1 Tax=Paractinoplanes ovalisporus TaxID=2810368 RepID=A0ABS2A7I1_9ACTN|nr:hypothetical protein [Actinoplanes ovalisporus]MBM2615752.1 hypothetical protein [Actinoplanes ovalisporus]